MRVLIVDDEQNIRETLEEFLQDEGYEVKTASNGADALSLMAGEEPPGLVILDMMLPLVSGQEVYERMQADPRLCGVPVIISTSAAAGAPNGPLVLQKPVNLDRLLAAVKNHCAGAP